MYSKSISSIYLQFKNGGGPELSKCSDSDKPLTSLSLLQIIPSKPSHYSDFQKSSNNKCCNEFTMIKKPVFRGLFLFPSLLSNSLGSEAIEMNSGKNQHCASLWNQPLFTNLAFLTKSHSMAPKIEWKHREHTSAEKLSEFEGNAL